MNREQFIAHVQATQGAFRRFLVALCCGDGQLADDIAQESYLKAYLNCEDLSSPSKFNSWLFRIGYNSFISHRRRERPSDSYDEARLVTADNRADDAFRYQALYHALAMIPQHERTSILLFYMEGYSAKEIADITQNTESTVRQHLARGRNHLRDLLSSNS